MPSIALIVNPRASRVTSVLVERVARELGDPEILITERRGHAVELARDVCGRVDALYIFSGDGGFNEVLNGADGSTPLGFVPGGGTNVLPRALGLPRDPVGAARRLSGGRTRRISLGRVNGRRFGFGAGVGLDAAIVRRIDALGRSGDGRRPGDVRATVEVLRLLAELRFRLDPGLEVIGLGRAAFALVCNTDPFTYVGPLALHVAPEARFELGLDVVALPQLRPSTVPRALAHVLTGRGGPALLRGHDLDRIELTCDAPTPLQADGEDLGDVAAALFEAERDAVAVLV